jgi:hypothetical protein
MGEVVKSLGMAQEEMAIKSKTSNRQRAETL